MPRTRTTNRDHAQRQQRPMMEDEVIAAQLEQLVTPALIAQEKYYRRLGMRDRILNLPLMVAAVLTLLWRDVAGVTELTRMLAREGFLWCAPTQVTQQALSQRFLTFPAQIFERIFKVLLPEFERKWHNRQQRPLSCRAFYVGKPDERAPLPESIQFARTKFAKIWAGDGSTLEAIFKKLESLTTAPTNQLAGKMGVVIDLVTRLPVEIWFESNAKASDMRFESDILNLVKPQTLILLDRGFCHYQFWQQLIERNVHLITRLNNGASFAVERVLTNSCSIRDGIQLQLWGTWLFYAVLVDLGDAVADELSVPFDRISLEMIYRGLYHFYVAHHKRLALGGFPAERSETRQGLATDAVKYFAAPANRDLGILKSIRKPFQKLIIAPFPDRTSREAQFFFEPSAQTCLTTALVS
jgi:Transposase DDE domain